MKKYICLYILLCFIATSILGPLPIYAQDFVLPAPGQMVALSPAFNPPILKGLKVHPENPFKFEFILDQGNSSYSAEESTRLIKYFLAALTVPEKDLWVNLSPYEKNRIVPQTFGQTEMGRDLLAEDYMLKQITASLIYPEGAVGRKFWKKIYQEAAAKFGTTNIPVNTFNKVWIVPEKAVVYENAKAGTAYVVEAKLKVMLEEDYLSMAKHTEKEAGTFSSQIIREIVIPELTKEVNEGKNFAQLRQVYNSLILATWYKKKIKDSILEQVYADKNKVAGVGYGPNQVETIYQQYLKAFKKGVYNYIKEDVDPLTQQATPRKYFSGGVNFFGDLAMITTSNAAVLPQTNKSEIIDTDIQPTIRVNQAMTAFHLQEQGGVGSAVIQRAVGLPRTQESIVNENIEALDDVVVRRAIVSKSLEATYRTSFRAAQIVIVHPEGFSNTDINRAYDIIETLVNAGVNTLSNLNILTSIFILENQKNIKLRRFKRQAMANIIAILKYYRSRNTLGDKQFFAAQFISKHPIDGIEFTTDEFQKLFSEYKFNSPWGSLRLAEISLYGVVIDKVRLFNNLLYKPLRGDGEIKRLLIISEMMQVILDKWDEWKIRRKTSQRLWIHSIVLQMLSYKDPELNVEAVSIMYRFPEFFEWNEIKPSAVVELGNPRRDEAMTAVDDPAVRWGIVSKGLWAPSRVSFKAAQIVITHPTRFSKSDINRAYKIVKDFVNSDFYSSSNFNVMAAIFILENQEDQYLLDLREKAIEVIRLVLNYYKVNRIVRDKQFFASQFILLHPIPEIVLSDDAFRDLFSIYRKESKLGPLRLAALSFWEKLPLFGETNRIKLIDGLLNRHFVKQEEEDRLSMISEMMDVILENWDRWEISKVISEDLWIRGIVLQMLSYKDHPELTIEAVSIMYRFPRFFNWNEKVPSVTIGLGRQKSPKKDAAMNGSVKAPIAENIPKTEQMLRDIFGIKEIKRFLKFANISMSQIKSINKPITVNKHVWELNINLNNGERRTFFLKIKIPYPLISEIAMKYDLGPEFLRISSIHYDFVEYESKGVTLNKNNIVLSNKKDALSLVGSMGYALGKLHGLRIEHKNLTMQSGSKTRFVREHVYIERKGDVFITRFIDFGNSFRFWRDQYRTFAREDFKHEKESFREAIFNYLMQRDTAWSAGETGPQWEKESLRNEIYRAFNRAYAKGFDETNDWAMRVQGTISFKKFFNPFNQKALSFDKVQEKLDALPRNGVLFERLDAFPSVEQIKTLVDPNRYPSSITIVAAKDDQNNVGYFIWTGTSIYQRIKEKFMKEILVVLRTRTDYPKGFTRTSSSLPLPMDLDAFHKAGSRGFIVSRYGLTVLTYTLRGINLLNSSYQTAFKRWMIAQGYEADYMMPYEKFLKYVGVNFSVIDWGNEEAINDTLKKGLTRDEAMSVVYTQDGNVWNNKTIKRVFEPEMAMYLPIKIGISNIKKSGLDITLRIEETPLFKTHFGQFEYLVKVYINSKETGSFNVLREQNGKRNTFKIYNFYPIGDIDPKDHERFKINEQYTGKGVSSSILNWLTWTAQKNGATMENRGTETFSLIRLYRRFFAQEFKDQDKRQEWMDLNSIMQNDAFFTQNLSIALPHTNQIIARLKVEAVRPPDNYRVIGIDWEDNERKTTIPDLVNINEDGVIRSTNGLDIGRVVYIDVTQVRGNPRPAQTPKIKILDSAQLADKAEITSITQADIPQVKLGKLLQRLRPFNPGEVIGFIPHYEREEMPGSYKLISIALEGLGPINDRYFKEIKAQMLARQVANDIFVQRWQGPWVYLHMPEEHMENAMDYITLLRENYNTSPYKELWNNRDEGIRDRFLKRIHENILQLDQENLRREFLEASLRKSSPKPSRPKVRFIITKDSITKIVYDKGKNDDEAMRADGKNMIGEEALRHYLHALPATTPFPGAVRMSFRFKVNKNRAKKIIRDTGKWSMGTPMSNEGRHLREFLSQFEGRTVFFSAKDVAKITSINYTDIRAIFEELAITVNKSIKGTPGIEVLEKYKKVEDKAMKVQKGGIDFTANKVPLQIKTGSPTKAFGDDSVVNGGIKFHLDAAQLAQLENATGFVPVIISVRPLTDLRAFLGVQ